MNREQTQVRLAVMQAYVDGKTIQHRNGDYWFDDPDPQWHRYVEYRVKPEGEVRAYTYIEMCRAVKKHGITIKNIRSKKIYTIISFDDGFIEYGSTLTINYKELVKYFIWLDDDSPCGVQEE